MELNMSEERVFTVCLPDPAQALEELENKLFEFQCLLDYVAANHPQVLTAGFGESVEDELHHVWAKYGLPYF